MIVHNNDFQIPQLANAMPLLEEALMQSVHTKDGYINEIASHLISAGGKRLRPSLALGAFLSLQPDISHSALQGAVAVELVHLASLYHDDVMDEASSRRGVVSVNSRWGNLLAIVSGDYLLARAAGIAARLGTEIAELLSDTLGDMCSGQILEVKSGFDLYRTQDAYLEAISGKTASLMATSCRIGAAVAGANERQKDLLSQLGHSFGMIFQIRDDVFDFLADKSTLGKEPGQDIVEGVYTLPVILAMTKKPYSNKISSMLEAKHETDLNQLNRLIYDSGAFDDTYSQLDTYLQYCKEVTNEFNSESLWGIVDVASSLVDSVSRIIEQTFTSN